MDTATALDELIDRFTTHQVAIGRAQGTRERHRYTFRLFGRFLAAEGLPRDGSALHVD